MRTGGFYLCGGIGGLWHWRFIERFGRDTLFAAFPSLPEGAALFRPTFGDVGWKSCKRLPPVVTLAWGVYTSVKSGIKRKSFML